MPDTIEINVKERIAEFQIITDNGYYIYIDEQGYIVDYSQESRGLVTIYGMEITEENIEKRKDLKWWFEFEIRKYITHKRRNDKDWNIWSNIKIQVKMNIYWVWIIWT